MTRPRPRCATGSRPAARRRCRCSPLRGRDSPRPGASGTPTRTATSRATHARIGRARTPDRQEDLCAGGRRAARGPAQRAVRAEREEARPGARDHQRRRERRPRRDRQPAHGLDGPAAHPRERVRTALAGGTRAAAGVALLAGAAAHGKDRHLHERVVPRGARRAARRRHRRRPAQHPPAGNPARGAHAVRRRRGAAQVLDPPFARRAEGADPRARVRPEDALAHHPRRQACAQALQQVARDLGARAARIVDRDGAVVRGRGHRRALPQPDGRQDPARLAPVDARAPGEARARGQGRGAGALGHRQRQADPRPRPHEEAHRPAIRARHRARTSTSSPA